MTTFDIATGKQVWRTALGSDVGEYAIGPTVAGGRVFVSTRANTRRGPKPDNFRGAITALDAKNGKILWRRTGELLLVLTHGCNLNISDRRVGSFW